MVKRLSTMWETWVRSLGQEDPLEKEMASHPSTLAQKIPWTEEPGAVCCPWGPKESDTTERLLFLSLKDGAIKMLHSIYHQIWKTQQWPEDWKRSILISIPKKSSTKECANHQTIALISHASKVMLKTMPARVEHYVNQELPDVQAGVYKRKRNQR